MPARSNISIEGVPALHGASHSIIPDRIEAGTYAMAAGVTGGSIVLKNARLDFLGAAKEVIEAGGHGLAPVEGGVLARVAKGGLKGSDAMTRPFPGFATDLQAQFMALTCAPCGSSAWTLGAVITGAGGVLLAWYVGTLSVNGFFYFQAVFVTLSMLLLGGVGSVSGGVVGAIVITLTTEIMRHYENGSTIGPWTLPPIFGLSALFQGLIIILVMKFRPEGLLGDRELDE